MTSSNVPEAQWSQLSEFIAARIGLHFPRERWNDMQRSFAGAVHEFGFDDASACIDWLLATPPAKARLQVLASHLTIGETYFFRDRQAFDALAGHVLPSLIRARAGGEQRLRIWSAACCSGEEAYSLAILLHRMLPDLQDWRVSITATDINPHFLQKAAAGIYGEWSFRDAPAWLKQGYFTRTPDGRYAIIPEIRKLVHFAYLNLVEDVYPSLETDTNAMDLIFCRNVLMYFTPPQVGKVIGNLRHSLVEGGWLAVSASEASRALFSGFATVNFPGAILFQKSGAPPRTEALPAAFVPAATSFASAIETPLPWPLPVPAEQEHAALQEAPAVAPVPRNSLALAQSLYLEGHYAEAVNALLAGCAGRSPEAAEFSLLARALANRGSLTEALAWCDGWIAADKLDPAGHYLRAVVLLEQDNPEQARASLQRAVYLDPDFVLAHFALGNLARGRRKAEEADRHFANALRLLRGCHPSDPVPESDGLTAGRLTEIITSMTAMAHAQ